MFVMVRELQPTPQGLPLEIYLFTTATDWVGYEAIQADLTDHILSEMGRFHLRVFQSPTGHDLVSLAPQNQR